MKKIFVIVLLSVCIASLGAATAITGVGGTTSDELKVTLNLNNTSSQYVWVGFTDEEVTSVTEDPSEKVINGDFVLELTTPTTASNDEANPLYISAQFAYKDNARVTLSGAAMSGTVTEDSTEYLGYKVTKENDENTVFLSVNDTDTSSIDGTTSPIIHNYESDWINFYSIPLKITTDSVNGKTATSFSGTITATIESN